MSNKKIVLIAVTSLAGCTAHAGWQPVAGNNYAGVPSYGAGYQAPQAAAQQAPSSSAGAYQQQQSQQQAALNQQMNNQTTFNAAIQQDLETLQGRLQRLERAMIRLDRRLQLIERNELNRMNGDVGPMSDAGDYTATPLQAGAPKNYATSGPLAQGGAASNVPPQAERVPGFTPVTLRQQVQEPLVTSTLQAAPPPQQMAALNTRQQARHSSMPSLSDEKNNQADTSVSVWTVSYNTGKIWPDRSQLPSSREVVEALRSGKPGAVFARGAEPNSRQFRERVRALSKYLSKVADLDNVAIATMDAEHLGKDTIEIFVTR